MTGPHGPRADGAVGQVELEPDLLVRRGVVDAPAGGQCRAEEQSAAVLPVGAAQGQPRALHGDLTFGIAVGDLDADAALRTEAEHVRRRRRRG